jgi:hypothetical protein
LQQRSRPQPQANAYGAGGASAAAEEAAKRAWLDKQDMPPGGQGRGVASQQSYDQYMANKHKEGGLGGGASSSAYRGSVVPSRPPQARGSGYDPSGPPLPKYSDMTRGGPPAPRAAPRPPVERRQRSWLKMASTLFEDSAPSASLDCLKARAASTHPRAQPEPLGGSPWPHELASGRPKVEDGPLPTTRQRGPIPPAFEDLPQLLSRASEIEEEVEDLIMEEANEIFRNEVNVQTLDITSEGLDLEQVRAKCMNDARQAVGGDDIERMRAARFDLHAAVAAFREAVDDASQ